MRADSTTRWCDATVEVSVDAEGMAPGDSAAFSVRVYNHGPTACRVDLTSTCAGRLQHSDGPTWRPAARIINAAKAGLIGPNTPSDTVFNDELRFPVAADNPTTADLEQVIVHVRRGTLQASALSPLPMMLLNVPLRPPG